MDSRVMNCCGAREIIGISAIRKGNNQIKRALKSLRHWGVDEFVPPLESQYIFTAARRPGTRCYYDERFLRYIKKNNLGPVISTPWAVSAKTGNEIKVYTWTMNKKRFTEFLRRA